jgi:hypothetical protein
MSCKLDVAIAEALGYEVIAVSPDHYFIVKDKHESILDNYLPRYSTDGNAMLKLDEEMQKRGYSLIAGRINDKYTALYQTENNSKIVHSINTMPESVAIAAYNVLTGKEWTSIV